MAQLNLKQILRGSILKYAFIPLLMLFVNKVSAQCTATLTINTNSSCQDSIITLTATPGGLYDYQWFVNGALGPLGIETWNYHAWDTGTYTFEVQITDFNNCTVISNPVTVVIHPNPMIGGTPYYNYACQGSNAQLSINVDTATSFSWTGPNSYTATGQYPIVPNFQVANIGLYTVVATNNGCHSYPYTFHYDTLSGVGSVAADVNLYLNNNNIVCEGQYFELSATPAGFTNVTSYSWTGPNGFTGNSSYEFVSNSTLADSGIYTVTITGTTCTGAATVTDTVLVSVVPTPFTTLSNNGPICMGNTLQLTAAGGTGGTYNWTGPNNFTSNQQNPSITNAQPANSGMYTLHATLGACDLTDHMFNVTVMSNSPSYDGWIDTAGIKCAADNVIMEVWSTYDITNPSYLWTGPNFSSTNQFEYFNINNNLDSGQYILAISGTGCTGPVTFYDTFTLDIRPCVWPGDVNNDMITDNFDVLDLGLAYGTLGPIRNGASYNWEGQYTPDWGVMQFCGQDMKFADCNGNGILTASDTFGIAGNYSMTHLKGEHIIQAKSSANTDLYFDMTGIVLTPGATVSIPIKLGTTTIPMVNVYGLAAQVKISGIVPVNGLTITAPAGWMGSIADALNFTKYISTSQTDWAYVRTDHNNASGDGTIAMLHFQVPNGSQYQQVQFYFDNVRIIGNTGNVITGNVNILDGDATVYPTQVAGQAVNFISDAVVLPNPSDVQASLQLTVVQAGNVQVLITDLTGRNIWNKTIDTKTGVQQVQLPADVAPGMYSVQVKDDMGMIAKSIKWVKK